MISLIFNIRVITIELTLQTIPRRPGTARKLLSTDPNIYITGSCRQIHPDTAQKHMFRYNAGSCRHAVADKTKESTIALVDRLVQVQHILL